jgi:hypothetical protein
VDWEYLSENPNAIPLLQNNLHKVDWYFLSSNQNAMYLLEDNLEEADWYYISQNPNTISLLENNLDKVNWGFLSGNPNAIHLCFTYDYSRMKTQMQPFAQELACYVFQPLRMMRFCEKYGFDLHEYVEIMG